MLMLIDKENERNGIGSEKLRISKASYGAEE